MRNHFPPESFSHRFSEHILKRKKAISALPVLFHGIIRPLGFLLRRTMNLDFCLGFVHLPVTRSTERADQYARVKTCENKVWTFAETVAGSFSAARGDWPSTGGVHEERDQSGGGRTHAVKGQHGVLELLLAHDVIWKGADDQRFHAKWKVSVFLFFHYSSCPLQRESPNDVTFVHTCRSASQAWVVLNQKMCAVCHLARVAILCVVLHLSLFFTCTSNVSRHDPFIIHYYSFRVVDRWKDRWKREGMKFGKKEKKGFCLFSMTGGSFIWSRFTN